MKSLKDRKECFLYDRAMSLHRRAYRMAANGDQFWEWQELAGRLGLGEVVACWQIWKTAKAARAAGMTKEQAFPLLGEMEKPK